MISYAVYRLIHFVGIFLIIMAVSSQTLHVATGGTRATQTARKLVFAAHGIGLLLVLVAGFGLLARLGIMHGAGFPGWIWAKLVIWLIFGALVALPYRMPALARPLWVAIPLLAAASAYLAIFKPF
jgi:hypothetical protein